MTKKGDTVRFLNAVGGGVVVRIDEVKRLIYVEDEDSLKFRYSNANAWQL